MPDVNRRQPLHPFDCACPRCNPRILAGRRRTARDFTLCALILLPALVLAASAALTSN